MPNEFIHNDPDCSYNETLSLHDCEVSSISYSDGILRFRLSDGLIIGAGHPENPYGKTKQTDEAVVDFSVDDPDDVTADILIRRRSGRARVKTLSLSELISAANKGKFTLEFLYQYRSFHEQLWHLAVHNKRRLYHGTCHLYLPMTEAVFRWNNLKPESE